MRILIDAKFLTHPQVGGFKTYVEGLVRGLAAVDGHNEYVICVDRLASETSDFLHRQGVCSRIVASRVPLLKEVIREQVYLPRVAASSRVDLAHFTCNTAPLRQSCPYVLTLHDVIALNNPYSHFTRPLVKSIWAYTQALYQTQVIPTASRQARRIITVSQYEKNLIVERLGVSPSRIDVIYQAANSIFRPINLDQRELALGELRAKYGIGEKYILSVGSKPSKNIPGLVRAYALLRSRFSDPPDLVLVIPHAVTEFTIRGIAKKFEVERYVKFLPEVSLPDLVLLYDLAQVFVFPSFREGFGLPPLEAMACGTPVVVANSSSLPEVVGDSAVLVDPNDINDIANGIQRVLGDPLFAAELREKGLCRAGEFSWEQTARQTVEVYHRVVA